MITNKSLTRCEFPSDSKWFERVVGIEPTWTITTRQFDVFEMLKSNFKYKDV